MDVQITTGQVDSEDCTHVVSRENKGSIRNLTEDHTWDNLTKYLATGAREKAL